MTIFHVTLKLQMSRKSYKCHARATKGTLSPRQTNENDRQYFSLEKQQQLSFCFVFRKGINLGAPNISPEC